MKFKFKSDWEKARQKEGADIEHNDKIVYSTGSTNVEKEKVDKEPTCYFDKANKDQVEQADWYKNKAKKRVEKK